MNFLQSVLRKKTNSPSMISGYATVDFYDGSIMYDFLSDTTAVCDIDFFRMAPVIHDKGVEWFGTKRLKAPEKYIELQLRRSVLIKRNDISRFLNFGANGNKQKRLYREENSRGACYTGLRCNP